MSLFVLFFSTISRRTSSSSSFARIIENAVCRMLPPFLTTRRTSFDSSSERCAQMRRNILLESMMDPQHSSKSSDSTECRSRKSSNLSCPFSPIERSPEIARACTEGSESFTLPLCRLHSFLALAKAFQTRNAATVAFSGLYLRKIRMISTCRS